MEPKVSIVIVTYNALRHIRITLESLKKTKGVQYEVIIVDNDSKIQTKLYLFYRFLISKNIKLLFNNYNSLFAAGNNLGVSLTSAKSEYVLLLNSDVKIIDPYWLVKLIQKHQRGATAYGVAVGGGIDRADGYCFLVNRDLYLQYKMDERYPWRFSLTKLEAEMLHAGENVQAIRNHDDMIIHYGRKSGTSHLRKDKKNFDQPDLQEWFGERRVKILESIE